MFYADRNLLRSELARLRSAGGRVVFTNGCFDLLHPGHLRLLKAARALGDYLLVALNTDASVRRLKGPHRPLTGEAARAEMILGLKPVDFAIFFDEPTPHELLLALKPHLDVLVKGGDYGAGEIVGESEVLSWGGKVERIPLAPGFSTTALEKKIREAS